VDYTSYLPNIDVEDGKARVMGNLRLYLRLLEKFDGEKMKNDITKAIEAGDTAKAFQAAHALRGTALNLGFSVVQKITDEIEILAKASQDPSHLTEPLNEAMTSLLNSIENLLEAQK
jgi:HPt (histidine-containing phosphotransfer) domain-containing protein